MNIQDESFRLHEKCGARTLTLQTEERKVGWIGTDIDTGGHIAQVIAYAATKPCSEVVQAQLHGCVRQVVQKQAMASMSDPP